MLILHFHVCLYLRPPKKVISKFSKTLQNLVPWDHAQMIERKILCRIALTRALYDQIRPQFFQKYVSNFDPPRTAQNRDASYGHAGAEKITTGKTGSVCMAR